MPLDAIILQIATPLGITGVDVYILGVFLVFLGVFAILKLERVYAVFFGVVLGIGIFVLLSTLLAPQYQTPETQGLISEWFAKIIVGSSVYLIFILSVLVPMNGNLALSYPTNPLARLGQTILLGGGLFLFYSATVVGLMERGYIFMNTNSAFALIKNTTVFAQIQPSKFYTFLAAHFPTVILLWVWFMIYKLLFADIVNAMITSAITALKNRKKSWFAWGGHSGHGDAHDAHDDHGGHDAWGSHGGHGEDHGASHGGWGHHGH